MLHNPYKAVKIWIKKGVGLYFSYQLSRLLALP